MRTSASAEPRTVVASLWSVSDDSTGLLLKAFYEHWLPGGEAEGDAAKALQLAMVKKIESGLWEVHEWAPFVAYGM